MDQYSISFEFFTPKTPEAAEKLLLTAKQLNGFNPEFFSVTFGAGGSTRQGTAETVFRLQAQLGVEVAPHISCIGSSREEISQLLHMYVDNGVQRIVALRGDIPSGMGVVDGDFNYANELVEFIRQETGKHFHIEVGAYPEFHPQAKDAYSDLDYFKKKMDAGANSAMTQYFYNPDAYFRFVEEMRALGCNADIVPGIMPITNYQQLIRFSDMCGAEVPKWIRQRLEAMQDDLESLRLFGQEVITEMCETLLENGAPGLHFYTLNKAEPSLSICKQLGFEHAHPENLPS